MGTLDGGAKPGTAEGKSGNEAMGLAAASSVGDGTASYPTLCTAERDATSYWRKGFVPLGAQELQEMERDKGEEAVQEYLDVRYSVDFSPCRFEAFKAGGRARMCVMSGKTSVH